MKMFLPFAFCLSSWAQENPSELKLPDNFLRFDISKLRPAISKTSKPQTSIVLVPTQETCGHIRTLPVNPDLDSGMTLPLRTYSQSRMPMLKGMPACQTAER